VIETPVGSASQNMDSLLGGVQAGYNFQTNSMVFGLETDFQFTGQKGDARLPDTIIIPSICMAPCVPGPPTVKTGTLDYAQKLPWFGTLRARVGVTPWDNWLIYATGGLAYGEIGTDASFTLPGAGVCVAPCTPGPAGSAASFNQMKAGWVLGGGVETALGGGWSGKLEYLHVDFGGVNNSFASAVNPFIGTFRQAAASPTIFCASG
jgi:outer membrane immunogenic protein